MVKSCGDSQSQVKMDLQSNRNETFYFHLTGEVKELAGLYNSNFRLVGMGAFDGFNLILLGALLGLIASWFSVHRHIRDIEPS